MRQIKLSGRERAVLRAVGFAEAIGGEEIQHHTRIPPDDLTEVLNALLTAGFIESRPFHEQIVPAELGTMEFEVNPSYVHELKAAMRRL
jgi:hypothetical protein